MKMQAARNQPTRMRVIASIFPVTTNRVANMRHMNAQLMRSAGQRAQRHQRHFPAGMIQPPIKGLRRLPIFVNLHFFTRLAAKL